MEKVDVYARVYRFIMLFIIEVTGPGVRDGRTNRKQSMGSSKKYERLTKLIGTSLSICGWLTFAK